MPDPFTDEDRERLERLHGDGPSFGPATRALAHIDHVEEALASLADEFDHIRVAVELERDEAADDENWRWAARLDGVVATWLHAAELARAALKGGENLASKEARKEAIRKASASSAGGSIWIRRAADARIVSKERKNSVERYEKALRRIEKKHVLEPQSARIARAALEGEDDE